MKPNILYRIVLLFILFGFYGIHISFGQDNKVYTKPDKMPLYSGGNVALTKFIKNNIKYPEEAKAANTKGKVVVSFIVEKNGALSNFEVINGIGKGCDEEALRVARKMSKWYPGTVGGKPVRVINKISIEFPPV